MLRESVNGQFDGPHRSIGLGRPAAALSRPRRRCRRLREGRLADCDIAALHPQNRMVADVHCAWFCRDY